MTEFAIGRYGSNDWRLLKWDGTTETEISTGWDHEPTLRECADGLMDHHNTGSSPFSSRSGTLDSLDLANQWPLPTRNMTLSDETMPWNDTF